MKRKDGFTLIELLVVIAIIAILAAILFPVFATAREKARQSTCASNEKQMGIAFLQYVQDYDEVMPITLDSARSWSWDLSIAPYLAAHENTANRTSPGGVFACPDDAVTRPFSETARTYAMPAPGNAWSESTGTAMPNVGMGGAWEGCGTSPGWWGGNAGCLPVSQVASPSTTFMLVEAPYNGSTPAPLAGGSNVGNAVASSMYTLAAGPYYTACYASWNAAIANFGDGNMLAQDMANPGVPLHSGGYNYLYGDGHVKWLQPNQTLGTGTACAPLGPWTINAND